MEGAETMTQLLRAGAAVLAGAVIMPLAAFAAAPDNPGDAVNAPKAAPAMIAPLDYQLGTRMVVRDWVLCVSETKAEIPCQGACRRGGGGAGRLFRSQGVEIVRPVSATHGRP